MRVVRDFKMKIGGWHRLWIVISAISLIFTIFIVVITFPTIADVSHQKNFYGMLSQTSQSQIASKDDIGSTPVNMPNNHIITVRRGIELKKSTLVFAEYVDLLNRKLWQKRIQFVGIAFTYWLVGCAVFYMVGWAFNWVYLGFKLQKN